MCIWNCNTQETSIYIKYSKRSGQIVSSFAIWHQDYGTTDTCAQSKELHSAIYIDGDRVCVCVCVCKISVQSGQFSGHTNPITLLSMWLYWLLAAFSDKWQSLWMQPSTDSLQGTASTGWFERFLLLSQYIFIIIMIIIIIKVIMWSSPITAPPTPTPSHTHTHTHTWPMMHYRCVLQVMWLFIFQETFYSLECLLKQYFGSYID